MKTAAHKKQESTRTVAAGEFKAKCLQLLDEVRDRKVSVVITKRGVPCATVVPFTPPEETPFRVDRGTDQGSHYSRRYHLPLATRVDAARRGMGQGVTRYLLDTHIWLWLQEEDRSRISDALVSEVNGWQQLLVAYISTYSAWEIALLVSKKQMKLPMPLESWIEAVTADGGLQLVDVSLRVLIESTRLPGEVQRDPADRMLLATVREHGMTLVTRDDRLVAYGQQGHARVIRR